MFTKDDGNEISVIDGPEYPHIININVKEDEKNY